MSIALYKIILIALEQAHLDTDWFHTVLLFKNSNILVLHPLLPRQIRASRNRDLQK